MIQGISKTRPFHHESWQKRAVKPIGSYSDPHVRIPLIDKPKELIYVRAMNKLYAIAILTGMLLAPALQAADLGRGLPIIDSSDEHHTPNFTANYNLGEGQIEYKINYSTRLAWSDLNSLSPRIFWNIYLKDKGVYLTEWNKKNAIPKLMLILGNWYIIDRVLLQDLLINQSNAVIVFAKDNYQPIFNIDLGELCAKFPDLFISGSAIKCDKITPHDVGRP